MTSTYLTGPALDVIRSLPDASVDLVASSPPFLGLRDYSRVDGQWGGESSPAAFLDNLLDLAVEFRRVLAPHGSIAIELGDTYSGSGGAGGDYNALGMRADQPKFRQSRSGRETGAWPLSKSLCGIPTLFAWSLAYGRNLLNPEHEIEPWRIRNIIVWARNNPAVGALGDKVRPATSYITVACPSGRRWFDLDAVRTNHRSDPSKFTGTERKNRAAALGRGEDRFADDLASRQMAGNPAGAPPLDHWTDADDGDLTWLINTQGSKLAHYAMWPAKLAERLILSMCPAEVCRACGEPRRRLVGISYVDSPKRELRHDDARRYGSIDGKRHNDHRVTAHETLGWSDCGCGAGFRPGVVLDPFAGTGTTLHAAEIHCRDAIGIDLDPANRDLVDRRRVEVRKALLDEKPEIQGQLSLGVGA